MPANAALPPTLPITGTTLFVAAVLFFGFIAVLFGGSLLVPGPEEDGAVLRDGTRKRYKLNGLHVFAVVFTVFLFGTWAEVFSPAIIHAHFWPLFVVANVFAFGLSAALFVVGRRAMAKNGSPRPPGLMNAVRDFWYGVELNPEWMGVDLKLFSYRPSLIGLALLNVSFVFVQIQLYGQVTTRMWLFQLFTFAYVVNYFQFEYGMLHTWDLIAERFGFMLVWGDYVFVPFFYSIAGWYLVGNLEPISTTAVVLLVGLYLLGFWLFRGANEQKHRFKTDPNCLIWGKPAEAIGGKLLVSGFWGIGRKLNYTGELLIYYAWTLVCGFGSTVPYLLPLWLTGFHAHRAWRDEKRCSEKYGELWQEYCRRARFRLFPFY